MQKKPKKVGHVIELSNMVKLELSDFFLNVTGMSHIKLKRWCH